MLHNIAANQKVKEPKQSIELLRIWSDQLNLDLDAWLPSEFVGVEYPPSFQIDEA